MGEIWVSLFVFVCLYACVCIFLCVCVSLCVFCSVCVSLCISLCLLPAAQHTMSNAQHTMRHRPNHTVHCNIPENEIEGPASAQLPEVWPHICRWEVQIGGGKELFTDTLQRLKNQGKTFASVLKAAWRPR